MEHIKLTAESRTTGKGPAGRMRRAGKIPAVVYGKKVKPQVVTVVERDLEKATTTSAGFNALFDLSVDGKKEFLVRICQYQAHPIRRTFTHVDFQAVDIAEQIEVEVPIALVGTALGIKEGGVVELQRRTLQLRCLVSQIPQQIPIDISGLNIGDSVHADQIQLPAGVVFPHDTNFTVVSVVPPKKEEEVTPVAAEAVAPSEVPAVAQKAPEEGAAPATEKGTEKKAPEKGGGDKAKK